MKKVSILDIPKDLLFQKESKGIAKNQKAKHESIARNRSQEMPISDIEKLGGEISTNLGILRTELYDWAKETSLPEDVLKIILNIAKRFKLNPLIGQIAWELNKDGGYEVYIPIDGWIAMMHQQASFEGLLFDQATETENGVPIWMECTIYRSNLKHPITVREYYTELKTDHSSWQAIPRRVLRHKTLQQCIRLAFGINYLIDKMDRYQNNIEQRNSYTAPITILNTKEILKNKLLGDSSNF